MGKRKDVLEKVIDGFSGRYSINAMGEVYDEWLKVPVTRYKRKAGGFVVTLHDRDSGKYVRAGISTIMAKTFLDCLVVDFIDGDNNNVFLENLKKSSKKKMAEKRGRALKGWQGYDVEITKDKKVVALVKSPTDAVEWCAAQGCNIDKGNLSRVLRGDLRTLKGYGFRKVERLGE